MTDPVGDIIGDYRGFAALQRDRLAAHGIDIAPYALSHVAYRVAGWDEYLRVRGLLEATVLAAPRPEAARFQPGNDFGELKAPFAGHSAAHLTPGDGAWNLA